MSISSQIERIVADKNRIRAKLVALGIATNTDNLDALTTAIEGVTVHNNINANVLEGNSYTIPKGYHDGSGVVNALTDSTAESNKYKTQSKGPIVPEKKQIPVSADEGYYALSSVTIAPIPDNFADVTDLDVEASHVLANKVFVGSDGIVTTGTMVNNGAVTRTLDANTTSVTIPEGYHNGQGSVKIVHDSLHDLFTPSSSEQVVEPESGKVFTRIVVAPIPGNYVDSTDSMLPTNQVNSAFDEGGNDDRYCNSVFYIKKMDNDNESEIFGVQRTFESAGSNVKSKAYVVPAYDANYDSFTNVFIDHLTASNIKAGIEVAGMTGTFTSDASATSAHILKDKTAYVNGAKVNGSMTNHGVTDTTIDGLVNASYVIPTGYHEGGRVSLDSSIENALAAI